MPQQLIHQKSQKVLAHQVIKATSIWSRLKGLMGESHFSLSSAFWILPCPGGVHTFFMLFPLDLIFVTKELKVVYVLKNIKPWNVVAPNGAVFSYLDILLPWKTLSLTLAFLTPPKVHSVFELKSPALSGLDFLQTGDRLYVGH